MSSSIFKRYSYGWITMALFLLSLVGHWLFGWSAYVDEQTARTASPLSSPPIR